MFSVRQKREIADKIQQILRETNHPELPDDEIRFTLHVVGAEPWSWAEIRNNGDVIFPAINPHNEEMAKYTKNTNNPIGRLRHDQVNRIFPN